MPFKTEENKSLGGYVWNYALLRAAVGIYEASPSA